ncbi:hypothetical protein BH09BAC3_BH09BAC3_38400 [soil metagenome]
MNLIYFNFLAKTDSFINGNSNPLTHAMKFIGALLFRNDVDRLRDLLTILKSVAGYPRGITPSEENLKSVLRKKNTVFYVAMDGDTVAGGVVAHVLPSVFGEPTSLYIQDIAVKKKYQRQKAGTLLIKCLIMHCRAFGHKNIYVQTKQSNKIAGKLFKSRNATPTQGFHFEFDKVIKVPKGG